MYDELVKRLRYCSEEHSGCGTCELSDTCVLRKRLLLQAADAIEELSRFKEECDGCGDKVRSVIEKLQKMIPHWIPVTEQPPFKVGDDGYNGYLVYANGYYEIADYTTDKLDNVPCFHVNGEYEPDVTHWMPLPEPPKEE